MEELAKNEQLQTSVLSVQKLKDIHKNERGF